MYQTVISRYITAFIERLYSLLLGGRGLCLGHDLSKNRFNRISCHTFKYIGSHTYETQKPPPISERRLSFPYKAIANAALPVGTYSHTPADRWRRRPGGFCG